MIVGDHLNLGRKLKSGEKRGLATLRQLAGEFRATTPETSFHATLGKGIRHHQAHLSTPHDRYQFGHTILRVKASRSASIDGRAGHYSNIESNQPYEGNRGRFDSISSNLSPANPVSLPIRLWKWRGYGMDRSSEGLK